ncbi:MAG: malectin domain-containing carbohydrate-binding protein [Verrucomicrobiota bacterium]
MTFRLSNSGSSSLQVSGLAITAPYTLINPPALPLQIAPGGQSDIQVLFQAGSGSVWTGTLTVQSSDSVTPSRVIELGGFWQSIPEGSPSQEPQVPELSKVFGYGTVILNTGEKMNSNGELKAVGDEVLSPYWVRAQPAYPVTVRQIAAYHTQGNSASAYWYAKGKSGTLTKIVSLAGADAQTLLPRNQALTGPASGSFNSNVTFGFKVDSEFSDPALTSHTADLSNGGVEPVGHHMRFWPVRDRNGALMPNTWLMGMDYAGINYDYNDNVYLITNIRPEDTKVDPSIGGLYPGSPKLVLDFNTTYPGSLTDSVGATTGFTSTQRNTADSSLPAASSSYDRSLLNINTAGQGTLSVTTAAGSNTGTGTGTNNLVNGTQLTFDGRTAKFNVAGTLLGPVDNLNNGSRQGGIMFGPDQDNFIKLAVENNGGLPSVHFYSEQKGVKKDIGTQVAVANPSTLQSIELTLFCDAAAGTVKAGYHAIYPGNDAGLILLPNTITLTGSQFNRFFAPRSNAGLVASSLNSTSTTITFDRFAVVNVAPTLNGPARYRLDVAGASNYTDGNGNVWSPDTGYYTPATAATESWGTPAIDNTLDDVLYQTYRASLGSSTPQDQRTLTYNLSVPNGTANLRLHFAEVYWGASAGNPTAGGPGRRVFDVSVNGRKVLQNFDITGAAGGIYTAVIVPIDGIAVSNGNLKIDFTASVDFGSISAIEVF